MRTNHYLDFLLQLKSTRSESEAVLSDPVCKQVLDEIALAERNKQRLTVSMIMRLRHIASPATLHRKLDLLVQAELVHATFEGGNKRTKYMVLTEAGHKYFQRLSMLIESIKLTHSV
jgi:DNA-binding MarR family transcriptional regulator